MKKFFAGLVVFVFIVGMLLAVASTFAKAEEVCRDDHSAIIECLSEHNNYQRKTYNNRYHKYKKYHQHHKHQRWYEARRHHYYEPNYYDDEVWYYEKPRLRLKLKSSLILRFRFD